MKEREAEREEGCRVYLQVVEMVVQHQLSVLYCCLPTKEIKWHLQPQGKRE